MTLVGYDIRLVILLFCSLWHTAAADCLPEPIAVRLGNVTLPDYGNKVVRGIDVKLGTPGQQFAFMPLAPSNNSVVYYSGNGICNTTVMSTNSTNACAVYHGGLYNNETSSTINSTQPYLHPRQEAAYKSLHFLQDKITFGTNASLNDYPFGIAQESWNQEVNYPQSILGVGPNSSILSSLKDANMIASRSWSMFWGLDGGTADAQMDGTFVMGGYDKAKTKGPGHKGSLDFSNKDCDSGLMLSLSDVKLNFRNGTNKSIFDKGIPPLIACIFPGLQGVMTLPRPYYNNYERMTGSSTKYRSWGLNYYDMLYKDNNNKFDGDITMTLANGDNSYPIQIKNDQLIVPDVSIGKDSGSLYANGSTPVLLLNALPEAVKYSYVCLGRQFLTSAYLAVNHDAGEFTIWEANPTTEENVVILDENNKERSSPCSASTNGQSISSGGIAGAVVGSVAGAALIAGAAFFLIWRKRKASKAEAESQRASTVESGAEGYDENKGPVDFTPRVAQELAGNHYKPSQELPTDATRHELPAVENAQRPHELPAKSVEPSELE